MPDLKELIEQRSKKQFKKKSYRPWDLTGSDNFSEQGSNLVVLPNVINTPIESNDPISTPIITEKAIVEEPLKIPDIDTKLDNKQISESGIRYRKQITDIDNKKPIQVTDIDNKQHIRYQKQITDIDNKQTPPHQDLGQYLAPHSTRNQLLKTTGIQKKIMDTVVDICISSNQLETGPLSTSALAGYAGTTIGSIKMAINRLIYKGFLTRGAGRTARGGYIFFHIDQDILNLFLQIREEKKGTSNSINIFQNRNKNDGSNQVLELDTGIRYQTPYSSSSYININTTTKGEKIFSGEWLSIDFSPLQNIGFTQTQLKQLIEKNSPEIVQESIYFFAADLKKNPDKYKQPLNVIMGVLRKGNAWSKPVGYELPKEKALREYTERKKMNLEKRNKLVSDLMDSEFADWQSALTEQEVEKIVPLEVRNSPLKAAKISVLRNYFRDHVLIPRLKGEGVY